MRVKEALRLFFESLTVQSEATRKWYKKRLQSSLQPLFERELSEVTHIDLQNRYQELQKRGLAVSTLHGYLRTWRRFFRWAYREGLIERNPMERIAFPTLPNQPPKAISDEDILKMLRACRNARERALVLFFADTGARLNGVATLTLDNLDLDAGRALVYEKGERSRFVFFGEATRKALEDWLRERPQTDDPRVFVLSKWTIYHVLRDIGRRAGVKRWNPHAFRHAFARRILENGGNLAMLSQLMGHSTIYVTVHFYGRFATQELQEFHRRFNRFLLR